MTPHELLLALFALAAVAASLGGLRWAYHRPRVIRLEVYRSAEELRLEIGRLQAVNVEGVYQLERLVLESVTGGPDPERPGEWTLRAIWRTAPETKVLRFRGGG